MIKNLKNVIKGPVALVILVLLSAYALFETYSDVRLLQLTANLLPLILVVIAVIGFALKGKMLPAHLILLFAVFRESGSAFINAISSFDFDTMAFRVDVTLTMVLQFIVFVYLVLFILSYILDGKFKGSFGKSPVLISALIAFLFFYFRSGFSVAVLKLVPPMIALFFGSEFFAILLLLAGVVEVPFIFLDHIFEATLLQQTLSYFIFTAFAFYLIQGAVRGLIAKRK